MKQTAVEWYAEELFVNYDDAELSCLKKLIEIVKRNENIQRITN